MAHPTGESKDGALKLDFDRRLMVQFRGCVVTSDAGLLAYRELDDALGLSAVAGETLADARTGKNGHHALVGLLRQSVFVTSPDMRTRTTPSACVTIQPCDGSSAARQLRAVQLHQARWGASRLARSRHPRTFLLFPTCPASGSISSMVVVPEGIVLDMDLSVSPTHGEQEDSVWNGHYPCTCYHPLFVFNQFGDLERCALRPGKCIAPTAG